MLVASDFRERARTALRGRWAMGVGAGFIASLLGAYTAFSGGGRSIDIDVNERQLQLLYQELPLDTYILVINILSVLSIISLIYAIILLFIGGPISLGYVKFNLNLADGKQADFMDLFSQFHRYGEGFLVQFLRFLYIALWPLVFAIPGAVVAAMVLIALGNKLRTANYFVVICVLLICMLPCVVFCVMKACSYAMAPYILYENPGMGANAAIKKSMELMNGNRWRLFCLTFSFIGWSLLSIFTLFIGLLWVKPYQEAAYAAFYREIYRERYGEPVKAQTTYPYEQDGFYQGYSQGFNDFNK